MTAVALATAVAAAAVAIAVILLGEEPREGAQDGKRTPSPAPASKLFAKDSIWNTPLGAGEPLDSRSSARVDALVEGIDKQAAGGIYPTVGKGHSTFYEVPRAQRRVPVQLDTGSWGASLAAVLKQGVPIPDRAIPGEGTDAHMVIWQPSTDSMWEFWRAAKRADGWHASWGGAISHVSKSPGYYNSDSWPGLSPSEGYNWGATASSLPEGAGLVRIRELRAGRIDHALAFDIGRPCAKIFAWPAQRTDGLDPNRETCIPEGARLRLDPKLDLSKLNLTPTARTIAEAAQRYGLIVRDRTFGTVQVALETPGTANPARDPYRGADGVLDGKAPYQVLENFPWKSLQVLKMSLCDKPPCEQ